MVVVFSKSKERSEQQPDYRSATMRRIAAALAVAALAGLANRINAQSVNPADTGRKLTGHWRLNEELTPTSPRPARGRGQPSFAIAGLTGQRGGRGGGGGGAGGGGAQPGDASAPLMAEEVAAQTALSILHQVPKE